MVVFRRDFETGIEVRVDGIRIEAILHGEKPALRARAKRQDGGDCGVILALLRKYHRHPACMTVRR